MFCGWGLQPAECAYSCWAIFVLNSPPPPSCYVLSLPPSPPPPPPRQVEAKQRQAKYAGTVRDQHREVRLGSRRGDGASVVPPSALGDCTSPRCDASVDMSSSASVTPSIATTARGSSVPAQPRRASQEPPSLIASAIQKRRSVDGIAPVAPTAPTPTRPANTKRTSATASPRPPTHCGSGEGAVPVDAVPLVRPKRGSAADARALALPGDGELIAG